MSYTFEKNKLYDFLGSSLVSSLKQYKTFVAGGTITSLFCNRDINDIDIYFRSKEDAANFVADLIEDGEWIFCHTKKATSFSYGGRICQVIHFDYFNSVDEIFKKFDFTVCMGAFDFEKEDFVLHTDFMKHNAQRILKFNQNTTYPIISALRVQKYQDKQYTISKPEYIKVILACMDLNINDVEDLKEQMGGMYGANYDNIIEPSVNGNIDLKDIMNKISDLSLSDNYFQIPKEETIPIDMEDIIKDIRG